MAAALRWRGCGCARASEREEAEERNKGEGESEGVQGGRGGAEEMTRGVAVARRRRQAAWWRGKLSGVAVSLLCLLARGGRRQGGRLVGWAAQ